MNSYIPDANTVMPKTHPGRSITVNMEHSKETESQPHAGFRTSAIQRVIILSLFLTLASVLLLPPGSAQPLPPPGGGFGQFSQGIPVYWPVHAGLMVVGFILLTAGMITAHFHKTRNWFRTHKILQISGAACIFAGLFVAVYMVTLSGFPHFANPHELAGGVIGLLVVVMIVLGFSIFRVKKSMNEVRAGHRWLGRALIALILVNIILGISTLILVLGL